MGLNLPLQGKRVLNAAHGEYLHPCPAGNGCGSGFETSDTYPESACALGMARIEGGRITDTRIRFIRPPRPRVCFTEIHGLTWSMLRDSPCFADLWPDFSAFMSGADYLVAHNASFDRRVLRGCCRAADIATPDIPFLCTVSGSRRGFRLRRNRLNDVCAHLGIALDHHKADSDALACSKNLPAPAENGLGAGSDASEIRPFRRNFPPAAILPPRAWLRCIRIVTRRFLRMLHGQGSMLFSSSRISRLKTTLDAAGKLRRHRADDVEPGSRSAQLRKLQNGTPPFRHDFC